LGFEAMGRLGEFIRLPLEWDIAIRWSGRGFKRGPRQSYKEASLFREVLKLCPEAMLLRTANQLANVQVKWEKQRSGC
jgi:hypothetical protein